MQRILTGWSFTRALYLGIGLVVIYEFLSIGHWAGALLGVYFASMGLFNFGCAANNCYTSPRAQTLTPDVNGMADFNVEFEEIKSKS